MTKPFRWSIAKREQLGSLASEPSRRPHASFLEELRATAARVLALADDADIAFIGRTPENFYDYLSGVFADGAKGPRLHLVQFSLRWLDPEVLSADNIAALRGYFEDEGVDPTAIAKGGRPLALVDMIQHGGTMQSFVNILHLIAREQRADWAAVQRRLKIIGLRERTKNSPNTWRWQQHQDWLDLIRDADIKNVSASAGFIGTITGFQAKVTASFHPGRWRDPCTVCNERATRGDRACGVSLRPRSQAGRAPGARRAHRRDAADAPSGDARVGVGPARVTAQGLVRGAQNAAVRVIRGPCHHARETR